VDGLKTLDENIVDQGGLQASWDAFLKVVNGINAWIGRYQPGKDVFTPKLAVASYGVKIWSTNCMF
jgi:hypothetical protein